MANPEGKEFLLSEEFQQILLSMDMEDACASVCDVERLHGKLMRKTGEGSKTLSLQTAAAKNFVSELRLEHEALLSDRRPELNTQARKRCL